MGSPYKVTIIAPTCFYYQAPLFRALAANDSIDLTVCFCTDEGSSGKDAKIAYGTHESWAPENTMLEGYKFKFLRNFAPQGSYLKSLIGLANIGVWREVGRTRPDAVVIMSWMNPTWWLVYLACMRFNVPLFLMTDANVNAEKLKSPFKSWLKHFLLRNLLFPATSGFLCAGTSNRKLYTYYGVPENKLVPFAYSWGYAALIEESRQLRETKSELRAEFELPINSTIMLYCGRLSSEKGLTELLDAYRDVPYANKALVLVGDGSLRERLQDYSRFHGLGSIYFMGFQNRAKIGKFYSLADILVLPSRNETWGMVVSEGLCFSLPVVVSDQVGSGADLVASEENGYVFPTGDVPALTERINRLLEMSQEERHRMGINSLKLITEWSNRDISATLVDYLDSNNSETKSWGISLLSRIYRFVPERFAQGMAFFVVGGIWGMSLTFIYLRMAQRRVLGKLSWFRR